MAGLPPDDFWPKTLPELRFIVKATFARIESDYERQRALIHEAAQLTAVAHHAPKKLPDYKPLRRRQKLGPPTPHDDARIHAFFTDLALRSEKK